MDDSNKQLSADLPHKPEGTDWGKLALRAWLIVLAVVTLIILIKMFRRGGAGMAVAMAAPAVAAASISRTRKEPRQAPKEIDQDFLRHWLSQIAIEEPLMTPAELCEMLNTIFRKDGRPEPFDSPSHLARELKKQGLQSSLRSVLGRSERRWYDLTEYGAHAPVQ